MPVGIRRRMSFTTWLKILSEAQKIAGMNPLQTVMAIARLEAKLQRPDKQVSNAPPPIKNGWF